jgi:hypothetical protein
MVFEKGEEVKNPYLFVAKLPTNTMQYLPFEDSNFKKGGSFNPKLLN